MFHRIIRWFIVGSIISAAVLYPAFFQSSQASLQWWNPGWISPSNTQGFVFVFADNPVTFTVQSEQDIVAVVETQQSVTFILEEPMVYCLRSTVNQKVAVRLQANQSVWMQYENPQQALVSYMELYQEYATPWQRRVYKADFISPIQGNQMYFPPEDFYVSDLVQYGAPYSWGGKQSLAEIQKKLASNVYEDGTKPASFQEVYQQKDTMHPANLDEGESIWDASRGNENPWYWTGVDCSGVIERCCQYAGFNWNWRTAHEVAAGNYRGCQNFQAIQPGQLLILKRNGMVVHFGLISRKGMNIPTTYMIHSAWFTNYRYNTNTIQKVIETSISEFRSVYTWTIATLPQKTK